MGSKIEMVKTVGKIVVTMGVGVVVKNLVGATTPANASAITKGLAWVGGLVIGDIAGTAAMKYVDNEVDGLVNAIKKIPCECETK